MKAILFGLALVLAAGGAATACDQFFAPTGELFPPTSSPSFFESRHGIVVEPFVRARPLHEFERPAPAIFDPRFSGGYDPRFDPRFGGGFDPRFGGDFRDQFDDRNRFARDHSASIRSFAAVIPRDSGGGRCGGKLRGLFGGRRGGDHAVIASSEIDHRAFDDFDFERRQRRGDFRDSLPTPQPLGFSSRGFRPAYFGL